MLNDVYRCSYNDTKYKYDKLQKFNIKGYDYKCSNYKIHLDSELSEYFFVFGRFMYCYILVLVVAIMMLYYVAVYRHCVGYDLVLISI
jgi:hypothetical protein